MVESTPRTGHRTRRGLRSAVADCEPPAMASVLVCVLHAALWLFSIGLFLVVALASFLRSRRKNERSVGFFHPFTSDGGGGERVLWCAVRDVQLMDDTVTTVVYTGDALNGAELQKRAFERFGVELLRPIQVVKLVSRNLTLPEKYPRFTMVGQAIGSVIVTTEALSKYRPFLFFDTTGHAFGYPIVQLAGCRVAAYVHYPTISSDMIKRVRSRAAAYNNDTKVTRSFLKSSLKLIYYRVFAVMYGLCGRCADVVVVNSTWTRGHVTQLWGGAPRTVFPPCDVESLLGLGDSRVLPDDSRVDQGVGDADEPSTSNKSTGKASTSAKSTSKASSRYSGTSTSTESESREKVVISVGQFRPEKDHALQLRAWALMKNGGGDKALKGGDDQAIADARLKFVGGCRGVADERRLKGLRELCVELGIENSVDFHVDVPFNTLRKLLIGAHFGLHAMVDEHFGICVVEYMASGAVPIAHASAGPAMDIVVPALTVHAKGQVGTSSVGSDGKASEFEVKDGGGVNPAAWSGTTANRTNDSHNSHDDHHESPVGFLACNETEYAACLSHALRMRDGDRRAMAKRARARAARMFGETQFSQGMRGALSGVFQKMEPVTDLARKPKRR